jgi:hypothetical protein
MLITRVHGGINYSHRSNYPPRLEITKFKSLGFGEDTTTTATPLTNIEDAIKNSFTIGSIAATALVFFIGYWWRGRKCKVGK